VKGFSQKFADRITGVLSGLDRVVFRGTIRQLAHCQGLESYLATKGVLLRDFPQHAQKMSERLKDGVKEAVASVGRPALYLTSPRASKEDIAREIAARDGVTEGTIALLSAVEPCQSFVVYRNRSEKLIELRSTVRKCLHFYRYFIDPEVGFGHARIQSWFPFRVQICLNGREWLARQMDRAGIGYERRDNCFTHLDDASRAQKLMDAQLRTDWPRLLDRLFRELNPAHDEMFGDFRAPYYWSTYQSEWATDFVFRDASSLAQLYPRWVRHAISTFGSRDVLRFLGRKVPAHRTAHQNFAGEVVSDLKQRPEGVRIKHQVNGNSIKAYDKQGSVLRIETTITNPKDFKAFRPKEGDESGAKAWRRLRKGVADFHRLCEVSHAANARYADALTNVDDGPAFGEILAPLCRPVQKWNRRFRGLRPWDDTDRDLLRVLARGEFALQGLRNRDLRRLLYEEAQTKQDIKRSSASISRRLRLLRAHGLLQRIPRTHRYRLTPLGHSLVCALTAADEANAAELAKLAA
jgi:DNA-binding HxlR family transcriptional regulator